MIVRTGPFKSRGVYISENPVVQATEYQWHANRGRAIGSGILEVAMTGCLGAKRSV